MPGLQVILRAASLRRVFLSFAALLAAVVPLSTFSTSAGAASQPLVAAEYFGIANPVNLWGSDISGAAAAFQQMKADGFNAVGMVLPWGYFEPGVSPPKFNPAAFSELNSLIRLAGSLQLKVILRLGYDWDLDPSDQLGGATRFIDAYGQASLNQAWVGYIQRIEQDVAPFHNVAAHYITWEDLWFPVFLSQGSASTAQRIQLANTIGYTSWLRGHYKLAAVGQTYGTTFSSWSQVPTPLYQSPSYTLMYKYSEWALINKFFKPAQRVYPGLTMETRVDVDPVYNGSQAVGSYTYSSLYRLPGTPVTGMYFSPYQGDPSTNINETASQGITALQSTLSTMSSRSGGRPLYIYEYEIVSNSPQVSQDPNLTPSQVPPFLSQSVPILKRFTAGFALWTYRDFNMSPIFNPSFYLGTAGWTATGGVSAGRTSGMSYLTMQPGGSVSQSVQFGIVPLSPGAPIQLTLQASAVSSSGTLQVTVGSSPTMNVTVGPGFNSYTLRVPQSDLGNGKITLTASVPMQVTNVQLFNFTQAGDVYDSTGAPEVGAAPLRTMNQQLAGAS